MRFLVAVMLAFSLSACAVGMLTPSRTFNTADTFVLPSSASNFTQVASEVGRSLDYDISSVDRNANAVTLSDNSRPGSASITGKLQTISFILALQGDGRTVEIQALATGNMGSVSQEKIEERMAAIERAMIARF